MIFPTTFVEEKLTSKQMIVRKEVDDVLGGAEARFPPVTFILRENWYMGLSENSVPLHPMVNDHYPY